MKVAALTSGRNIPSARFRIRQYQSALLEHGIAVTDYCPALSQGARLPGALGRIRARYMPPLLAAQAALNLAARLPGIVGSHRADLTWLERNFIPGLDDLAPLLGRPLVLDIDDAIWLYNPLGESMVRRLVRRADMVFAGNTFIADWCSSHCKTLQIVPTAIDCERFRPRAKDKAPGDPFVIGWTGTSGNFRFLKMIEPALARFLAAHPDARFLVVADRKPELPLLPQDQLVFEPWQAHTEHTLLHRMDVGLMPIDDSDMSRGKCSFKMLQYMASGLPVIVSPFGMNRQVLAEGNVGYAATSDDDWFDAMSQSFRDRAGLAAMGAQGRSVVTAKYSLGVVAASIAAGFGSLASNKKKICAE